VFGVQHFSDHQHLPTQKHGNKTPPKKGDLHRGAEEFGGGASLKINLKGGLGKFQQNQPRRLNGLDRIFGDVVGFDDFPKVFVT